MITGAFSSDTTISTPVAINKGGTGQTTAQAALDALAAASGSLVQGDIFIVDSSTNVIRLARGSDNYILKMNGSNPNWEAESGSWVGTATSNLAMANYNISATGTILFTFGAFQISSGSITTTKTLCRLDTEGYASTDNLDVNAGSVVGNLLIYSTASSSRDVTIVNDTGTGKRHILGADFTCDTNYDTATFFQLQDDDRISLLSSSNNI